MLLNQTSDLALLAKRYSVYSRLKQYYQGDVHCSVYVVNEICDYLEIFSVLADDLRLISEKTKKSASDISLAANAEFDYNRLFIGPGKLLAPPYESAYLNEQRLVMQEETLAVRAWYERNSVKVRDKNILPDDHLGLELEFICYLLSQAGSQISEGNEAKGLEYLNLYKEFFQEHIKTWVYKHLEDVRKNAKTALCFGAAVFMDNFLKFEEGEG